MITTTRDRDDSIPINNTNTRNTRTTRTPSNNYFIEFTNRMTRQYQYHVYQQQQQQQHHHHRDNNNELDNEYRINIRQNDGYGRTQSEHRYHHRDNDENSRTSLERIITIVKLMELVIIIVFFAYLGIQS
jgi:hypothetical protein